jgi:protein disulfide-isomerase A6
LNAVEYHEFSEAYVNGGYPSIKLFQNNQTIEYDGGRRAADVVNFINTKCGTERGTDGLLNDQAGLIPEAGNLTEEFLGAEDKASYLPKMKAIAGAEFYVKVMERYIAKGPEQIGKDLETMVEILDARRGSPTALDGMKRRFNVFAEFLPEEAPPSPTPTPAPLTDEEEAAEVAKAEHLAKGSTPADHGGDPEEGKPVERDASL